MRSACFGFKLSETMPAEDVRSEERALVERYLDQPPEMPREVRGRIETALGDDPIQLYALADLDETLRFSRTWVALGEKRIALAAENGDAPVVIDRASIREVREEPGLSCSVLRLGEGVDRPALAELRYTHRQKASIGNIRFVLDQNLDGGEVRIPANDDEGYLEGLAKPVVDAQATVAANEIAVIWRLLGYLKPYTFQVVAGMAAAALLAIASLVPPYLTGVLVDDILQPFQFEGADRFESWSRAWILLAVITGAFVLRFLFLWVRLHIMAILGEFVAHDMRRDVYAKVQQLSVRYFSRNQTGTIVSRVGSDTDRIWEFVAFGVVEVSLSAITLLALSVVLLTMDRSLGLVMVIPVPLMVWAIIANGRNMQRLYTRAWRKWSSLNDVIADTIPGIRVVKAFHQEARERERFGTRNREMLDTFNRVHGSWTKFWPLLMLAIHGISIAVYWLALPRLFSDPGDPAHLSLGTLVAFLLFMGMFFQPIEVFGNMSRMLNRSLSSARRVFDLIDTEPETITTTKAVRLEPLAGEVEFRDVHFGYEAVRPVLRGISFKAAPGEMIGIVGPSGAGKTTLANLIIRFYDVNSGSILIDGVDIRALDVGEFRRRIGVVQQNPFLFHGTILENIRYGCPGAGMGQVIEAARSANAHEFVCNLPQAYDTLVGERGHTLSGGERQRVALARALVNDPRILILDEAMSSVDSETEEKIHLSLEKVVRGRTIFAIAHRLSTLKGADRILVLKEGRLVEEGTPEELLSREGGVYRKLSELQGARRR